ncbi:MAG: hypothetical protein KKE23_04075 [Nanoarchaeota archaeon]|nr:hypothetical protein [Nanoarchaeota archaeon]
MLLGALLFSAIYSSNILVRECTDARPSTPYDICTPKSIDGGPVDEGQAVQPTRDSGTSVSQTSLQSMTLEDLQQLYDSEYKLSTDEDYNNYNNMADEAKKAPLEAAYQTYNQIDMDLSINFFKDNVWEANEAYYIIMLAWSVSVSVPVLAPLQFREAIV